MWGLSTTDIEAALLEVTALATQAAQLRLRLLAHAKRVDVGQSVGATSAANWLAHESRTTRAAAHRAARLASRLDEAHPAVDGALADAAINVEQAAVIVDAVDALPTDLVAATTVQEAEAFLLAKARDHDARALRILGRRLLEVLDPDSADAEEEPQRIAMGLRDGGCTAVGCDRPPAACHVHHDLPWSKGGNTDLKTGRLLCPRHHTLAHDHRYQLKTNPNGKVTFSRRT